MNKSFLSILLFFLMIININANIVDYPLFNPDEYLDGRIYSDLILSMSEEIKFTNYTKEITLITDSGLRIVFAGDEYIHSKYDIDGVLFGAYSSLSNSIGINVESINVYFKNNTNYTKEEINIKIFNTFQHEITHYLYNNDKLFEISESLGIEYSNYPYLSNYDDFRFFAISPISQDIPNVLLETVDFQNYFEPLPNAPYTEYQKNNEIIARLMSVCVSEDFDYLNYYDIVIYSNYDYCQNLTFHSSIDNNYNSIYNDVLIAYVRIYNPELLDRFGTTKDNIRSGFYIINVITSEILFFLTNTMINYYLVISILSIIYLIFAFVIKMFRQNKS